MACSRVNFTSTFSAVTESIDNTSDCRSGTIENPGCVADAI
jgi:hypothetical protein